MAYELIIWITDIKNLLALTEVSTRMGKIVSLKEVDENERRPAPPDPDAAPDPGASQEEVWP
jgi:hypothetical protein